VLLPAIGKPICGPNARTEIGAVNLYLAGKVVTIGDRRAHRLAELFR
jgi:hypothetical protein